MTLIPILAAYCPGPLPPHVNNSVRSTNSLLAGTRVTYSCIEGHIFPADGTYAKGAYCSLETLEWIGAPNGCIGEYVLCIVHLL